MKQHHAFRLSEETFETLKQQAERENRSMAGQIEYLVLKEEKQA